MKKRGFTLLELMAVVVIISILASIAMPIYTRSIERARAMEAMANIKAINDAVYVYYSEKEKCPEKFSQLLVTLPTIAGTDLARRDVNTKFFRFILVGNNLPIIPGTPCRGTIAWRRGGGNYVYAIYNPYQNINGQASSLACTPNTWDTTATQQAKSQAICEALGLHITVGELLAEE